MMNASRSKGAAAPAPVRTCRPVHLQGLPLLPKSQYAYTLLPEGVPRETLLAEFQAAPQFAQIRLRRLMEDHRGALRVILLADSDYYACQAAVYLTALFRAQAPAPVPRDSDGDYWEDIDFSELEDENSVSAQVRRSLAVLSPALLDPELRQSRERRGAVSLQGGGKDPLDLNLRSLDAPAALIAAPGGPVLTPRILEQVEGLARRDDREPLDLFFALRPDQVDLELLEELRFTYGFQTARVGQPDGAYLCRFLRECAEDLLCPIDKLADLEQVVAHTRRCRGAAFRETDLESLVLWAVQRHAQPPLTARDLLFAPFQSKREAWSKLEQMTGLQDVKGALRRLLAAAALAARRRQRGETVRPFCRNLAFAGPPGTGKSVTARLAARILREEGCGTGRFVEAGREQLIGTYLGETSPKIAELFERARGGVLFIDEAGALLDGGNDIYAAEAVNALVRHMELEPETMVILATYPDEMRRLLDSNPGLASRVARTLEFQPYDDAALWEILQGFAREDGCPLPEGAEAVCRDFFSRLRRQNPEGFGNGREARRLYQGAVEEMALRTMDAGETERITLADLHAAVGRLMTRPGGGVGRTIGFS